MFFVTLISDNKTCHIIYIITNAVCEGLILVIYNMQNTIMCKLTIHHSKQLAILYSTSYNLFQTGGHVYIPYMSSIIIGLTIFT